MAFDFTTLEPPRHGYPAWKLVRSDHAAFAAPNVHGVARADLGENFVRAK